MDEILETAVAFVRALVRFKWIVVLCACLFSTLGWAYVYQLNDEYTAKARVFVDSNRVLAPLLKGIAIQPDVNQRVLMMSRMLLSRPNLEKLSRMTDLDINAVSDYERELMLNELGRTIRLSGVRGNSSLYNVRYSNSDPVLAKRMVQALITIFIETTLGDERKDSESAQEFLNQQIRLYEQRLSESEKRLSDFKRENSGKMPSESGGYYQRLDLARTKENAARLELLEARNRRDDLRDQLKREPATLSEGSAGVQSPIDIELSRQYGELSALSVRYTDKHPKIAQLRDSIAALEARKLTGSATEFGASFRQVSNPVHEEMRKLLSETQARVAELEVRVTEFSRQTRELNDTVDSIPGIEAELAQLDRDYNIVKAQYETVLERRESARLSEQVEQNADDVQFRVIDPPFVPSKPTGPDKLLLSAITFAAALGAGAGLAFLFSLIRPVFYSTTSIANKTGRSMLGSVSKRRSSSDKFRDMAGWLGFSFVVFLLVSIFLLLLAFYSGMFSSGQMDFLFKGDIGYYFKRSLDALLLVVEKLKEIAVGMGVEIQ